VLGAEPLLRRALGNIAAVDSGKVAIYIAGKSQGTGLSATVGCDQRVIVLLGRVPTAGGTVSFASSAGTAVRGLGLEHLEVISVEADQKLGGGEEENGANGDTGAEIEGLHLRHKNKLVAEAVRQVEQTIDLHM
jgi:hypothetical protein